ncbi:hypothetical protein [Thermococcus sp. JCM 11816]|uniref:hypothetical protein n=1 Tax=Thermococcus sp. (strain JCM 11816 / KS-1) TaxID=1295125 RepID=UPI000B17926A
MKEETQKTPWPLKNAKWIKVEKIPDEKLKRALMLELDEGGRARRLFLPSKGTLS